MRIVKGYTFDDVLLVPQYSDVLPSEVSLETRLSKNLRLKVPIISAAMDTVTESKMAIAMLSIGGGAVIHKNLSVEQQSLEVKKVLEYFKDKEKAGAIGGAVGTSEAEFERAKELVKAGVDFIVVDTAHGHSKKVGDILEKIKANLDVELIAGNIASREATEFLIDRGVDAVKVGIGPGSICTTRIVAGVGVPQLSAIELVVQYASEKNIPVIADGGVKYSGDIVKALAVGASTVMLGSLLAGTDEAPGELVERDNKKFKSYRGMGSLSAMRQGSADRYFQNKNTNKLVPEGVEALKEYKGTVQDVLFQLLGGLRSGMGYLGAKNLDELVKQAFFVEISNQGLKESHVHDVMIAKKAPNY